MASQPKAEPVLASPEAAQFYVAAIRELSGAAIPFLLAGTYALSAYTGVSRMTKDLDIFCKSGDAMRILTHLQRCGYRIEMEDERWLGKVFRGPYFFDVIFGSSNGAVPVTDDWFVHSRVFTILGQDVRIVAPTELLFSKTFIQLRHRYDGPDVAHIILACHSEIDWRRLLAHMEQHWEVLLIHLLNFRWIYPSERNRIPGWLFDELLQRLGNQRELPPSQMKICRGRMLSRLDYRIDVDEWGFADVGGEGDWRND